MKILIGLILLILFVIVLILLIGFCLMKYVIKPKRISMEESISIEKSKNFWGDYDSYPKEEMNIESFDDYLLHGILLKNTSDKYVIITHGYTYTRYGSVKYANIFYSLGYNVYLYDLRHHGANANSYCSMSYLEGQDIIAIKEALKSRFGKDIQVGLHGESLGAASSIAALGLSREFTFCIADCGFSDLSELLIYQARRLMHMPGWIVHVASGFLRIIYHYSFYEVKPITGLHNNLTPILFIHGENDDFILPSHSKKMYEACNLCHKELFFIPNAKHAESYESDPQQYATVVHAFLERIAHN